MTQKKPQKLILKIGPLDLILESKNKLEKAAPAAEPDVVASAPAALPPVAGVRRSARAPRPGSARYCRR
jgi:hypothetical protein